ncbi:MAG: T9SS type A sorting domain-containing protein [candidate division WOR-3 bacterium]|nr:T9SS type A sorting domain-containing protein [candidate division WOR-3 bacterium]
MHRAVLTLAALTYVCLGQPYEVRSMVLDGGGNGWLRGSSYTVGLSIGQQTASGVLTAGQYRAMLGFWHQPYAPLGVAEEVGQAASPLAFRLNQNAPNPFGRQTAIRYTLPQECDVALRIYNSAGRAVTMLVRGRQKPGRYMARWDVSGVSASRLPAGTYFCRLEAGEYTATRKMVKTD